MNIFGERQNVEKYIPLLIHSAITGNKVSIHSNSDLSKAGTRFYTYAGYVAKTVWSIIDKVSTDNKDSIRWQSPMYHIVGKREVDNLELALLVEKIVGKKINYELVNFHESRPGHDLRYALQDNLLNFEQEDFETSLERVVKWYLTNLEWMGL